MHASITLSGLTCTTADGHTLFKDISAIFGPERTGLVGRNGVGKSTLLRVVCGTLAPTSGKVVADGRIAAADQSVAAGPDETIATLLGIEPTLQAIAMAERGEADTALLSTIDWTAGERAEAALSRFSLSFSLSTPLSRLSGGEITRARLAALAFAAPDFILLDEPTNNLDAEGRMDLFRFLDDFRGGALVVSHDRALLEHMDAIVELTSLGMTRYGGNFSFYEAEKESERNALERDLEDAEKQMRRVSGGARQRNERKARSDARGRAVRKRKDQPKMLLDRRKGRAEGTDARQSALTERQVEAANAAVAEARARFEVMQPFSVALMPSGLAASRRVLSARDLCGGYDGGRPLFADLSFEMVGPERLAICGRNGAGKSTLLKLLTGDLSPLAGAAGIFVPHAVFDQTVSMLDRNGTVRDNFRRLNPHDDENACRAALARFQFRADAALKPVSALSGGEQLRAGLAVAIGGGSPVELLILDEPTNHLEIESLATLEAGLNAYDGAILAISHDATFLERIGVTRRVELDGHGQ